MDVCFANTSCFLNMLATFPYCQAYWYLFEMFEVWIIPNHGTRDTFVYLNTIQTRKLPNHSLNSTWNTLPRRGFGGAERGGGLGPREGWMFFSKHTLLFSSSGILFNKSLIWSVFTTIGIDIRRKRRRRRTTTTTTATTKIAKRRTTRTTRT